METEERKAYIYIIKGVIISIITTIILLFIFSVILTYTNLSEKMTTPFIIVITALSIFIGSSLGNIKIKRHGLLNGAIIGAVYLIFIYLISGIINKTFTLNIQSIILIISSMICGMIGGIIGINKK